MGATRKIAAELEGSFALMWGNPTVKADAIAARFGVSVGTVFNTARRLGLPKRMPVLERLGLPPFGRRKGERAA